MRHLSMQLIAIVAICIISAMMPCDTAYSVQLVEEKDTYVHHEYLYGTARIDYIEVVCEESLTTYYYRYDNRSNEFIPTSVEVCNGSKYASARPAGGVGV